MDTHIQAAMEKAKEAADQYRARVAAADKLAKQTWERRSALRAIETGLDQKLGLHTGRIDDEYTAEVPLTIGWNSHDDGTSLAYVALGGVDVSEYLPPDVLADIQSHVSYLWDEESGRAA